MRVCALLICAAFVAYGGDLAEAAVPRLAPSRDVTVDYEVEPRNLAAQSVRVEIGAGGAKLRITGETLPTVILVDRPAGQATLMLPLLRAYTSLDIAGYDPERTVLRHARFERHGTRRLAGLTCTDWTARSASGNAAACITEDGVILEGSASDARGVLGSVAARRVTYGALPPEVFARPPDYREAGPWLVPNLGVSR